MKNHRNKQNKQNYTFWTKKFRDRYHLKGGVSQCCFSKIVSEYDQEIPQSQTADNPVAPRGRATQPSRDTRKTN